MRESWRNQHREVERPRLNLVRGADGRLRQAGVDGGEDIADIWTEQKHIHQAAVTVEAAPQYVQPGVADYHDSGEQTVKAKKAITISLPKPKMPRLPHVSLSKVWSILRKKHTLAALGVVLILVLSVIGFHSIGQQDHAVARQTPSPTPQNVLDATDTNAPTFKTVLPTGKSIQDLGGWVRVSPADKDPVFAYVDMVDSVQLNISQQRLPESLRTNTSEEVAKLAAGFAANEKIDAGGVRAYLGTSIRGPQSLIFVKHDLLILIKSSAKLTNQQWTDYVASLN